MGAGMVEVELGPGMGAAESVPPAKRRRVVALKTAASAAGRRPRRARRPSAIQRLFQACRAVFRGPGTVPAPAEVALLRAMLDRMRPEDVGLSSEMAFFRNRDAAAEGTPTITHTTIYKSEKFSMVLFFLPTNAAIPLHNHPGMTVFNKLLIGSMHATSYDWADPDDDPANESGASSADGQLRLAQLVVDDVFTAPCDTSVLFPTAGGNMHRFRAVAPSAFLDILGPPYSIEEDRDCTYYTDIPYSQHRMTGGELGGDEQEGRRLAWLKEVEMPRDLKMCSVRYGGPPISGR
ncbi:2-aminoethanethiol dioxygenase [Hordeum vulgare]|nr:2-aminoethanethiol dioxygenase [Hordeum vulgare]